MAKYTNLTSETKSKRAALEARLDQYCRFHWRNTDAFKEFGAFIINKNDLKFYNGATYTNNYTKPQFESAAGTLTGVTFSTAKITFSIGVYWFSEEQYRKLIYWLHPYEISNLAFDYDPLHVYLVKLANIGDSNTRSVVGYETTKDGKTEPRYYTELKLTFDIQGESCAYNSEHYIPEQEEVIQNNQSLIFNTHLKTNSKTPLSDLSTTLTSFITLNLKTQRPYDGLRLQYIAEYRPDTTVIDSQLLFDVELKNLLWLSEGGQFTIIPAGQTISATTAKLQSALTGNNFTNENKLIVSNDNAFVITTGLSNSMTIAKEYKKLIANNVYIGLKYDSNSGLLYILDGSEDGVFRPITLQTTTNSGERIVDNLSVNKFAIPGLFDWSDFDLTKVNFKLIVSGIGNQIITDNTIINTNNCDIICRGRTNLI